MEINYAANIVEEHSVPRKKTDNTDKKEKIKEVKVRIHALVQEIKRGNSTLTEQDIGKKNYANIPQLSRALSKDSLWENIQDLLEIEEKLKKFLAKEQIEKSQGTRNPQSQKNIQIGYTDVAIETLEECIADILNKKDGTTISDLARIIDKKVQDAVHRAKLEKRCGTQIITVRNDIWEKLQKMLTGETPLGETAFEKKWGVGAKKIDKRELSRRYRLLKTNLNLSITQIIQKIQERLPELDENTLRRMFSEGGGLPPEQAKILWEVLDELEKATLQK